MLSWFAFVSMGIYPNAGTDHYLITGPRLKKTTFNFANGNTFITSAPDASESNIYVQSATLNGEVLDR